MSQLYAKSNIKLQHQTSFSISVLSSSSSFSNMKNLVSFPSQSHRSLQYCVFNIFVHHLNIIVLPSYVDFSNWNLQEGRSFVLFSLSFLYIPSLFSVSFITSQSLPNISSQCLFPFEPFLPSSVTIHVSSLSCLPLHSSPLSSCPILPLPCLASLWPTYLGIHHLYISSLKVLVDMGCGAKLNIIVINFFFKCSTCK